MKEIDFIPDWYRADRKRRRDLVAHAMFLGVLAICLGLFSAGRYVQTAIARESLAELQDSAESQKEVVRGLGELERRLNELKEKQRLLADVAGGAPVHGVLAKLSRLMPASMVLTEIRVVQQQRTDRAQASPSDGSTKGVLPAVGGDGKIDVAGWAASDVDVGNLMTSMSQSALFRDVTLRYSKPVVVNGRAAREFKLACRLPQFE